MKNNFNGLQEIKIGLVVTSVPHFPVEKARESMDKAVELFPVSKNNLVGPYLVTTSEEAEEVGNKLKVNGVDALIMIEGAFTWDNILARLTQELGDLPTAIWALPEPPMRGGKISLLSLCGAIMNGAALKKLGKKYKFIYGPLEEEKTLSHLKRYLNAVATVKKLRHSKYCLVGYRPTGFYNSAFDELYARKILGIETIHLSLADLLEYALNIPDKEVEKQLNEIKKEWKIGEAAERDLYNSAKLHKFLVDFSQSNKVDCYGIKCWPEFFKRSLSMCFVVGLLINEGIMTGCEADFEGTVTMLIEYYLSGRTPYLADLTHLDEGNNTCVFWHCGAAPPSLASSKSEIIIQKQFRNLERGAAIEFPLKSGRVTIARLGIIESKHRMFITTGEALPTKLILRGNPSIVRMDSPVKDVLNTIVGNGVAHHYAVVYGDYKDDLIEFCRLLDMELILCKEE